MIRIFSLTFLGFVSFAIHSAEQHIKQIRRSALEKRFILDGDTFFLKKITPSDASALGSVVRAGDYFSYLLARVNHDESFRIVDYPGDLPGAVPADLLVKKYKIIYLGIASGFEPRYLPVVISHEEGKFKYEK